MPYNLSVERIRNNVENLAKQQPEFRDVFLCHAWDDRQGAAKELHDLLESRGVSVWFSEKDVGIGVPLRSNDAEALIETLRAAVPIVPTPAQ